MHPVASNSPLQIYHLTNQKALESVTAKVLMVGGLLMAIIGLNALLKIGSLSQISQVDALILFSTGTVLSLIFITSLLKERLTMPPPETKQLEISSNKPPETKQLEIFCDPIVYEANSLSVWNVTATRATPPPPDIAWNNEDPLFPGKALQETSMLFFVPKWIWVKGEKRRPTLNLLLEIFPNHSAVGHRVFCEKIIQETVGDIPIKPGWRLIKKDHVPGTLIMTYDEQKNKIEGARHLNASVGELVMAIMLHHAHTGEYLFPYRSTAGRHNNSARCAEKVPSKIIREGEAIFPVVVGCFGPNGLYISSTPPDCPTIGREGGSAVLDFN